MPDSQHGSGNEYRTRFVVTIASWEAVPVSAADFLWPRPTVQPVLDRVRH